VRSLANPCTAETLEEYLRAASNLLLAKGWKGGRYNAAPTQELPLVLPVQTGGRTRMPELDPNDN